MSNYVGMYRTSYFRVTDEEKYRALVDGIKTENELCDFRKIDNEGLWHSLASKSPFVFYPEPLEYKIEEYKSEHPNASEEELKNLRFEANVDIDEFFNRLSEIMHEDDACVFIEIGYEDLDFMICHTFVVTKGNVRYRSIENSAREFVLDLLGLEKGNKVNHEKMKYCGDNGYSNDRVNNKSSGFII